MNEIGICSITFRALSPRAILDAAAAAGLGCIEWGSDIHAPASLHPEALSAIARATHEAGLRISSYGTYHRLGVSDPSELQMLFSAAKTLGTPVVRVWAGAKGTRESTPEERAAVHAATRTAAARAAKEGLALSFECHPDTLTDDPDETLSLLREGSPETLGTHWQPNQHHDEEWNLAAAATLAPRVRIIHSFAWTIDSTGRLVRHTLSEHASAWKRYFAALPASAPALLEFLPDDSPASLPRESASLRSIRLETP